MTRHLSFTAVCGQLASLSRGRRADLHIHTTASDGTYTPSQVVALARQRGLCAVAITDHDTLAGIPEARLAAAGHMELVSGVEISTSYEGRELHLLGYFVRLDDADLNAALATICDSRRVRFRALVDRLGSRGVRVTDQQAQAVERMTPSLGRQHVGRLLTTSGHAGNITEALHRFVKPLLPVVPPKQLLPIGEAIRLVRAAGGVASLAHPPSELTDADLQRLRTLGLHALEAVYPWGSNSGVSRVRTAAVRFGFAVSGGSDCHGPNPVQRRVGSHTLTSDELAVLRRCAACANC